MSEIGFIVVSEQPYGGKEKLVFRTADAEADANHYRDSLVAKGIAARVEQIDIVNQ